MPKTRILREIEKEEEVEQAKDMLKVLQKIEDIMHRTNISDVEKRQLMNKIIDSKMDELKLLLDGKQTGDCWDFSQEKAKHVFVEDELIVLRGYRDEDNSYIRQIKKENCEKINDYDNDEAWEFYCNWLKRDNTFVCSILKKNDNQYIGYISIKDTSRNLWEIAIELLAEQCNKGYGYRAVSLFLSEVSRITEKKQFQTLVEVDNIPSQMLMEKLQASLIDIYDYSFGGDEKKAQAFEECHLDRITDRMRELAKELSVEPRKLLSHVLDYRIFVENGKIVKK